MSKLNRRGFLHWSSQSFVALSATAAAGRLHAQNVSANDTITLGLIGCGGRGTTLLKGFAKRPDVRFAYTCDPNARRAASASELIRQENNPNVKAITNYKAILDDREVDAVIIATPPHWHALPTIEACQAGKDVYVEKTPSYCVWEGRKMVEAARKYNRVVQVGTQNRSAEYNRKAVEYVQSGKLGKVHLCRLFNTRLNGPYHRVPDGPIPEWIDWNQWLGPAPDQPYNDGICNEGKWHYHFCFCGGDLDDDSSHSFDLVRWVLGLGVPKSAFCFGGNLALHDSREDPDVLTITYEFDDLLVTYTMAMYIPYLTKTPWEIRYSRSEFPNWPTIGDRIEIYGTEALMILGRHGGGWQVFTHDGEIVAQEYGYFPDEEHQQNFIDSLRSRQLPNADIEQGHRSSLFVHIGNTAYKVGNRKLTFDAATESYNDDDEANRYLKRKCREPFIIPDEV